jgi:hypothetical protein
LHALLVCRHGPPLVLHLVLLLAQILESPRPEGHQKIHYILLVTVLRDVHRRLLLLILVVHIRPAISY